MKRGFLQICFKEGERKCVREKKKEASNVPVRERGNESSVRDNVRSGHIGNRWQYNGKLLGANYAGGKRNSSVSFMFSNFPDEWGMGNLWMIFKKHGTVFDMFMVRKRLRNGQRYGFVRFKFVVDTEELLKSLRKIKIRDEYLRVFVAYDRRNAGNRNLDRGEMNGSRRNTVHNGVSGGGTRMGIRNSRYNSVNGGGIRMGIRDSRRYADVVHGVNRREKVERYIDERNGAKGSQEDTKYRHKSVVDRDEGRTIELIEDEFNGEVFNRSLLGEVKKGCYLSKLLALCEEQGLSNVEVKLLGGLEVMVVFDSTETVGNILSNVDHGIRRWLHKLRKWSIYYKPSGRFTWINIIGVPVSCWTETVFRKIAELHGSIVGTENCNLVGNQNLIIGRVQIHTCVKGLINEALSVKFRGMIFKVNVVEEIKDICEVEIEEVSMVNHDEQSKFGSGLKNGGDDMVISEEEDNDSSCDESNGKEEDSGDEEEGNNHKEEGDRKSRPVKMVDQNCGEDEASRVSGGPRVGGTLEGGAVSSKDYILENGNEGFEGFEGGAASSKENLVGDGNELNMNNTRKLEKCDRITGNLSTGNMMYEKQNDTNGIINNDKLFVENSDGPIDDLENLAQNKNNDGPIGGVTENNNIGTNYNEDVKIKNMNNQEHKYQEKQNGKIEQEVCEAQSRGEKREDSSPDPNSSGGIRNSKKRRANFTVDCQGSKNGNLFSPGVGGMDKSRSTIKIGRKSIKKAKRVARHMGAKGLGDDAKGMSDIYKEFVDERDDNEGGFTFKSKGRADSDNKSCSINMEQVKEVGELIGVSWAMAEEEKKMEGKGQNELL
ncbi:Transposon TX1 [Artemisia annua]|uniref:Transposon TX1 n=1 Tax=Artemisia annua TaxID=35608 RepID=A0A2U1NP98_ARTAN|nr:Transposon TX1 [Artemisia annua]